MSRVIQLHFSEGDVDHNVISMYQQDMVLVPTFVYDFLDYISVHMNEIMHLICRKMTEYRQSGDQTGLVTPRYREAYASMSCVVDIFYKYAIAKGFVNNDWALLQEKVDERHIYEVILQNDEALRGEEHGILIIKAMLWALETGLLELQHENSGHKFSTFELKKKVFIDSNFLYIKAESLWECAKDYFANHGRYFQYRDTRTLVQTLKDENLILSRQEGEKLRNTHKLYFDGHQYAERFVFLQRKEVEKVYNLLDVI